MQEKKYLINKNIQSNFPISYGIYIFWKNNDIPLYIGKSNNLRTRISTYFSKVVTGKTLLMVNSSKYLSFIQVASELEALLLEAELINRYKPKYNLIQKDDKSPIYINISNDNYPIISVVRKNKLNKNDVYFGPFISSKSAKIILRYLRKIFPYADHLPGRKPCIYSQIQLCNPCPSIIEKTKDKKQKTNLQKIYSENIKYIRQILERKFSGVKTNLEKKMLEYSKNELFEEANIIKGKIEIFDYITQEQISSENYLKNPNLIQEIRKKELNSLKNILNKYFNIKYLNRIECYDISHISGLFTSASMITFLNADPEKKYYRHFRIRKRGISDDISSLDEVIQRRIKHLKDWGTPNLIVVDGGKAQLNVFNKYLKKYNIPVVAFAKRPDKLIIIKDGNFVTLKNLNNDALNLLIRLRNEAHRFARRYHQKLVKSNLIPNS